ncbi:MAG: tetraacyldisaccharide 4'-kinase [Phycisphaerae bacterium]
MTTTWSNLFRVSGFGSRVLGPLGGLYGELIRVRNFFYDRGLVKTVWLPVPVISVGNLTTGGTGKTPMVVLLGKMAEEAGYSVGVVLRGYGSTGGREADEVILLGRELPGAMVSVCGDRILGGRRAISQSVRVLIADDGFQHRRLGRDLDICLVDATNPFGGGKMIPAGRLREPVEGLGRADIVVLTRCEQVERAIVEEIKLEIRRYAGDVPILVSEHRVRGCEDLEGNRFDHCEEKIGGRKVFAFAGIGQPEAFFNTVRKIGGIVVGTREFRDHHYFTVGELREIREEVNQVGADFIVCTMKDRVKISAGMIRDAGIGAKAIFAIAIEIFMEDEDREMLRKKIWEVSKRVVK